LLGTPKPMRISPVFQDIDVEVEAMLQVYGQDPKSELLQCQSG